MTEVADLVVLAVEDCPDAMDLLCNMLTTFGINHVYPTTDGRQALDFLGQGGLLVDVVIADWQMPSMSGIELLKHVRSVDRDLPFLMITGAADLDSVAEAKAAGVSGFIKKPYSAPELKRKLKVIARISEGRQRMMWD